MKFKSELITSASGSIGGVTYAHARGGVMYRRARSIPVNTMTSRREVVRNAMATVANNWHNLLTIAQRSAWNTYAQAVAGLLVNKLGDPITLTGQQMFIRCNQPRVAAGLAEVDDGPVPASLGARVIKFNSVDTEDVPPQTLSGTVLFSSAISVNATVLLYMGLPVSDGAEYFRGPWQLFATQATVATDASEAFSAALGTTWLAETGRIPLAAGRFAMRARMSFDDGRLSQPYDEIVDVTTP